MPAAQPPDLATETFVAACRGRIDPDAAFAYALATNDPNDAYRHGDWVPPLFTSSLIGEGLIGAERYEDVTSRVRNVRGGVHGQHDVHLFRPFRTGMGIQWTARVYAGRQTSAGVLLTVRIVVWDLQGVELAEHFWSSLLIGGVLDVPFGPDIPDHRFPPRSMEKIGRYSVEATRDQGFRFAGASGDRVSHSVDDEAARREGFAGKILQGLCTLGMCSGGIVQLGAGGDPDRVRRLAGRLSAPMYPGQMLEVDIHDAGRTSDGAQALAFQATAAGIVVVKHGWAEIAAAIGAPS
jgi:acyl dehydratase